MPTLPDRPQLTHLRRQAKARSRERAVPLHQAQHELARDYGFASWPRLVHHVQAGSLAGIERALVLADSAALGPLLAADPSAATRPICGPLPGRPHAATSSTDAAPPGDRSAAPSGDLTAEPPGNSPPAPATDPATARPPLLTLLRRSTGTPSDVRTCARLLLDAGADPDSHTVESGGEWRQTALFAAVERHDLALVRLLLERGATRDEDAFYHACEQSDLGFLDALYVPGFERMVRHKLDFEDAAGLRWFLDHGVHVDAERCLHWAISRGRGVPILQLLLDAGADVNLPQGAGDDPQRRPLALAARCGHLAAYDLLVAHGATAELDAVDAAVLAVARGESTRLPQARPPVLGTAGAGYGWILGQFALLGRTEVVRSLLDAGMQVDTRGWSNFTPLDQAAMHGRTETVRLLVDRGADLHDCAFDEEGPTPLDCAIWGSRNNRAADGDYRGTVEVLVAAGAPTRHDPPTGDPAIDALLVARVP